jgi:hypothetical protein
MTHVTTAQTIVTRLTDLGEQLNQLRRMVDIEDNAPLLIEELHAHTLAVIGYQVSALEAARMAFDFAEQQNDLESNRRALAACTQAVQDCSRNFYENLYTISRIADMIELLNKETTADWADITIRDLTVCHLSLQAAAFTLMDGWQEFAGRAGTNSVSVRSSTVGQQFLFPA